MVFGPIMLVWLLAIAFLGARGIALDPGVLAALSPHHAVRFMLEHLLHGFLVLGGVVLVITGGEALSSALAAAYGIAVTGTMGRSPR